MRKLALLTALLTVTALPASAAALRGALVHVSSDVVTLGDLFDAAGPASGLEVARAPAPGKTISLDGGTLSAIALANSIDWHAAGQNDRVIVMRDGDAATGMPAASASNFGAVTAPLVPALAGRGAGDKLAILLDAGEQQHILSALPAGIVLAVDKLDFDPATRRFAATLTDAASGRRIAVSGRALPMVKVPVPSHRIAEGDTIRAADLDFTDQRADTLRSDTELKSAFMVGKVAKRQLEAGLPVQDRFLALPTIIKRGDRVTMIVRGGGILLMAEGRAESDAGVGEIVHLSNAASNKEIDGIATGPGTAEVQTAATIVSAAASTTFTR